MKARIMLALMLVAAFLLPGGTASAGPGGVRGVTGSIGLEEFLGQRVDRIQRPRG